MDKGWPASSQYVLDVLLTCAAPAASFPAVASAVAGDDGLGLLHRAVRSGSTPMVLAVLGWGVEHRYCFAWDAAGPMGLTPLHLMALLGRERHDLARLVLRSNAGENGKKPASVWLCTAGVRRMQQADSGCVDVVL